MFISFRERFLKLIKFITQSYVFIAFEFIFILKQTFCLPKIPQKLFFFSWLAYMSLHKKFSVLVNYTMWSSNHFSASSCFQRFSWFRIFRVQVFFSWVSRCFWDQVQCLGSGFRSNLLDKSSHCLSICTTLEL